MGLPCGNTMTDSHNCTHAIHKFLHQVVSTLPKTANPKNLNGDPVTTTGNSTMDIHYDYKGALLFVVGLLCMYGLCILLLIISLIRKSRTELELVDHLRDFEAMRRASQKKGFRLYNQNLSDEHEDDNSEAPKIVPVLGYKSIRPDPDDDDEYSDIMSVSRAKRKDRRDSFTDSRVSSQDTVSSIDDNLSESSFSPIRKEPQVLCMYCARKLTTSGECVNCEQEKAVAKAKPQLDFTYTSITNPNGLFQPKHYSPEREKYWVEKDPKVDSQHSQKTKYPRIAPYHSVDSTHHKILDDEKESEEEYIPRTSQRRRSFLNMRLTKQFSIDCPSDDESGAPFVKQGSIEETEPLDIAWKNLDSTSGDERASSVHVVKPKRPLGSSITSRTYGTMGLQWNSRWAALKALYMEKGSLCSANVEENIPEEDEEDALTG